MSGRDVAITNKAICYGIAAVTIFLIGLWLLWRASIGWPTWPMVKAGLAVGVVCPFIAETFIKVPKQ